MNCHRDLHMHTVYSDGGMTPAELANLAHAAELKVVSLTDHDCVDGIREMNEACEKLGIINIHGAEMSAHYGDEEVHILAYNPLLNSPEFARVLEANQAERKRRVISMIEKFKKVGYGISLEEVDSYKKGSYSSSFVVRAVCKKYGIKDVGGAIRHFFHELRFYEPTKAFDAFEMIELIHKFGATAVLAHPMRLGLPRGEKHTFIRKLAAHGLDGIEAFYKNNDAVTTKEYVDIARELNLKATCGGDVHFSNMPFFLKSLPELADYTVDLKSIEI